MKILVGFYDFSIYNKMKECIKCEERRNKRFNKIL